MIFKILFCVRVYVFMFSSRKFALRLLCCFDVGRFCVAPKPHHLKLALH